MEPLHDAVSRILKAIASGSPFEQCETEFRRLQDEKGADWISRVLLEPALTRGRLDWVQEVLSLGASLRGEDGRTALELAREMSKQHPSDSQRKMILGLLKVVASREQKESLGGEETGGRREEQPKEVSLIEKISFPQTMDLPSLQRLLGVDFLPEDARATLATDKLRKLENMEDSKGNTLLMKAVNDGERDCVDLLLRCGFDVNKGGTVNGVHYRAIDLAVRQYYSNRQLSTNKANYRSTIKLLLEWDTTMPNLNMIELMELLQILAEEEESIREMFEKRDEFHESIESGDIDKVKLMLTSNLVDEGHGSRFWTNSNGISALYTAYLSQKTQVSAFLISCNFRYMDSEKLRIESNPIKDVNKVHELDSALGKYFSPVKDHHVLIMALRTLLRMGRKEKEGKEEIVIQDIYEAADKIPEVRLLMQCLQYDPNLEVILEMVHKDVTCLHSQSSSGVLGIWNASVHRIFASAALETISDTVSNLAHEMCHAVLDIIFDNSSLPYCKGDEEMKADYNVIFEDILLQENLKQCNEIIKRVNTHYKKNQREQELIVRVPEIIAKHTLEKKTGEPWEQKEKRLFDFYHEKVEPCIISWIKKKSMVNAFSSKSRHLRDQITVMDNGAPRRCRHNGIHYFQVSNLALGVSHLKGSLLDLICVDWKEFLKKRKTLEINLRRRNFGNLAIVWDEGMGRSFCLESKKCNEICPASGFSDLSEYITLVIPKSFTVPDENKAVEYEWDDLSTETKDYVMECKVNFQGQEVSLKEMIDSVVDTNNVQSMKSLLEGPDIISSLIDGEMMIFGSELNSQHPRVFVDRTMKIREISIEEQLLHKRMRDAIFIFNAKESDLERMSFGAVSYWDGENISEEGRCFFTNELPQSSLKDDVWKRLCGMGKKWEYVHFFRHSQGNFIHTHSQSIMGSRCQLLADRPGCGKTVFVHHSANEEKKMHQERWTEVVELPECEDIFSQWDENDINLANGGLRDFLYDLLAKHWERSPRNMILERKLFSLFSQSNGKASIYFDAFDEICPENKAKFSNFIKALLQDLGVNVFITTRTNDCNHLEELISVFGNYLVPFNRKEQVRFLNAEWSFLLHNVEPSKQATKLNSIISNLMARPNSGRNFQVIVEKLEWLSTQSKKPNLEVDFSEVAKEAIEICRSSAKGKEYLSGAPLHAWMIAQVYFEDNFSLPSTWRQIHIYERFLQMKLQNHCSGKGKVREGGNANRIKVHYANAMRKLLKKFSAYFFLREEKYCPTIKGDMDDLLRAGLLVKKGTSYSFVHRTFGEHIFSVWLLEEANHPEVTRILLRRVLVELKFQNVREYIDQILLSSDDTPSVNEDKEVLFKIIGPNTSAIDADEGLLKSFRTCFHMMVVFCHQGILKYLSNTSEERLADVLFATKACICSIVDQRSFMHANFHNAFRVLYPSFYHPEHLDTILTLLTLTKKNGLIEKLKDLITTNGLEWTGINEEKLWLVEGGKERLISIINFLVDNRDILGEAIKGTIMGKEYKTFFKCAPFYSFNEWKCLLESVLEEEDFKKMLVPTSQGEHVGGNANIIASWLRIVSNGSEERFKEILNFFESKLKTAEEQREFLRRHGVKCLIVYLRGVGFLQGWILVQQLMVKELGDEALKQLIFESFRHDFTVCTDDSLDLETLIEWLKYIIRDQHFGLDEAVRLLCTIPIAAYPFHSLHLLQDFISDAQLDEMAKTKIEILLRKIMEGKQKDDEGDTEDEEDISYDEEENSYDEEDISYDEEEISYDEEEISCDEEEISCDEEEISCDEEEISSHKKDKDSEEDLHDKVNAWHKLLRNGSAEQVEDKWNHLKSELQTREERKEFLHSKDRDKMNCLFWSVIQSKNNVKMNIVWSLIQEEFSKDELKEFIIESFTHKFVEVDSLGFKTLFDWLTQVTGSGLLSFGEVKHILSIAHIRRYSSYGLMCMQNFLVGAENDDRARVEIMEWLKNFEQFWSSVHINIQIHDFYKDNEVRACIAADWKRIMPSYLSGLPENFHLPVDKNECIVGSSSAMKKLHLDAFVAFLVLSSRQLELILKFFPIREVIEGRLIEWWYNLCRIFNKLDLFFGIVATNIITPYLFAIPNFFFPKELSCDLFHIWCDLENIIDYHERREKLIHAYDIAHLCFGKDALWVFHSYTWKSTSILNILKEMQDKGIFQDHFPYFVDEYLSVYPADHSVDLSLYSRE